MENNNRRKFLKNTSLSVLGLSLLPKTGAARQTTTSSVNPKMACDKTTLDYYGEGPFYRDNPPALNRTQLASATEPGTRLIISGRVFNLDCNQAIPNARIDVWHANDAGAYDNDGFGLRGYTLSNEEGFYLFETIKPGKYLNGNKYRPSHIHFKITPPGFEVLTTQLYFEGDEDIPADASASITSGPYDARHRTIALEENAAGKEEGVWDIVINGEGAVGTQDIHLNKGMIYKVTPNPFSKELEINYGVFKKSQVSLSILDLSGREVAVLEEKDQLAEKYTVNWKPESGMPGGHYFIVLKINDLQVHYQKIIYQP